MGVVIVSQQALEAVIGRAILDQAFRMALFADPEAALADYQLSEGEFAALKSVDAEALDACARGVVLRLARKVVPAETRIPE